jgi:hypothetical protein
MRRRADPRLPQTRARLLSSFVKRYGEPEINGCYSRNNLDSAYTGSAERMIGILFSQRKMDSPEPPKVFADFWTLAYAALK